MAPRLDDFNEHILLPIEIFQSNMALYVQRRIWAMRSSSHNRFMGSCSKLSNTDTFRLTGRLYPRIIDILHWYKKPVLQLGPIFPCE